MSFSWLKNKKIISSFLLIFTISALGIFIVGIEQTKAGWWDALTNPGNAVFSFLSWIVYIIFRIFALLLKISGLLLDWAFGLEHFTDVPVVQEGWRISQGVVNLFFVLILMFIAFATILRLDEKSFGLKALLPKLIIAALLINFSLVIGGAIIDFTQVLSHYFLESFEGQDFTLSEYVANGLNITKIFETKEGAKEQEARGIDGLNILIGLIGGVAVIITMFIVMIAAAGFLIVRVVALWFLLVLAPIAWLFWILPGLSKQWSNWWSSFLKWAFFAPAFAFFFYLTLLTLGHVNEKGEIVGGFLSSIDSKVPLGENEGWASAFFASSELILQYIFLIILLIASLIVAQKAGVYGAGYAITTAKWVGKGAAGWTSRRAAQIPVPLSKTMGNLITKAAGQREGRFAQRLRTLGGTLAETRGRGVFSPGAWKRVWPEISKERERRAYGVRSAELRDQLTSIFSLGREKSDYGERAKRQQRIEERKKVVTISAEELVGNVKRAFTAGLVDVGTANIQALAEQGDLNDLLKSYGYKFDAVGLSKFTEEKLKPMMGEQDAYRLMFDMNRAVEKVGQWPGRVFKGDYDEKTGKTVYKDVIKETVKAGGTEEQGAEKAMTEAYKAWSRMDPQEKSRFTHRLGVISEDEEGRNAGVEGHEMFIRGLSAAQPNVVRMQDEVKATLMLRHAEETKNLNKELYNQLSEIFEKMEDEQIKALQDKLHLVAPGVTITSWRRGGGFASGVYS